jgi:Fe2+ transport system protein FeoA
MKLKIDFNRTILKFYGANQFSMNLLTGFHPNNVLHFRDGERSGMISPDNTFTHVMAQQGDEATKRSVTPLNLLPFGVTARVVSVEGESAVARRLMEMGVVPGAPVCVIKAAPLGDPIEVRVRGYHLALRRTEAQTITVVISDK